MSTWAWVGIATGAIFALGDLAIFFGLVLSSRWRRHPLAAASHTFPRLRLAMALFFGSAAVLRVVDIVAGERLTTTLVVARIIHGIVLWYGAFVFWACRKRLADFLEAIAIAERGDR